MKNPFYVRFKRETCLLSAGAGAALLEDFDPMLAEHPMLKAMRDQHRPKMTMAGGGVAVIPIEGVLCRKPSVIELSLGAEDIANVLDMVNKVANDPNVKAAVLNIDSPGGFVTGGPEVADAVARMKKSKPCVAWTGGSMCSLAYWIGSQASEIVSSRSASVGSIGVYTALTDTAKAAEMAGLRVEVFANKEGIHKGMGIPGTSLTPEQRDYIQSRMQSSFDDFKAAVTATRGPLKAETLRGQSFSGQKARLAGLVDRLGDLSFAIARAKAMTHAVDCHYA
jgi:signal peptide peptidase SppA